MKQYVAAGLLTLGFVVGACAGPQFWPMPLNAASGKWEYQTATVAGNSVEFVNGLGDQGWEIVGFVGTTAFLKRPKP